jgi:radical SAM superfamily enzyme YgiQ (UPF0313 family)
VALRFAAVCPVGAVVAVGLGMIRNVVLIYPAMRRYSGYLSAQRVPGLVCTHAGLTILKQVLERDGIQARAIDEQLTPFSEELVLGADLVGISLQTCGAEQGYRIARQVRRLGIPVVFGGAHATLNPDEAIEFADFVVRGEGEHTLRELVAALNGERLLRDVRGLTFREQELVVSNPERPPLDTAELDRLPWPQVDLIDGVHRLRHPLNSTIHFTMLTRGCNQACNYCSITRVFGRSLRHRSIAGILDELGSRWDPARQFLFFNDDSLAVGKDFLKELLSSLIRERLIPKLGWHSQLRVDCADDPELLQLMKATNCTFVSCGFESPNDRSLKALGKGQSVREVERGVRRLHEHGMLINGFFLLGTDHDAPESIGETVRFAERIGCTLAGFMPLTPYPGTPIWTKLEREGRIFTRDWELYDMQHVVFRPARMTPWQLYSGALSAYAKFYGGKNPWKQARRLAPSWPAPALAAIALTWPIARHLCWSREVIANLDYIAALRRLEASPHADFPKLSAQRLWWKDIWSGRGIRRLHTTASRFARNAATPALRTHLRDERSGRKAPKPTSSE